MTAIAMPLLVAVNARPVNKWVVTASIAFGSLMAAIDSSIVNVALPEIRGTVGATVEEITWVSTSYIIATVLVMPLTGFLGAFFGQKRIYVFEPRSLRFRLGALRSRAHVAMLVLYRAIQGLGAGALQPTQQAILRQTFPPKNKAWRWRCSRWSSWWGPPLGQP